MYLLTALLDKRQQCIVTQLAFATLDGKKHGIKQINKYSQRDRRVVPIAGPSSIFPRLSGPLTPGELGTGGAGT